MNLLDILLSEAKINDMQRSQFLISATELANYVVCPQAWALKRNSTVENQHSSSPLHFGTSQSRSLRKEWVQHQEVSFKLHKYTKALLLLLGLLVLVLIAVDSQRSLTNGTQTSSTLNESQLEVIDSAELASKRSLAISPEIYLLLLILGTTIVILDFFLRKRGEIQKEGGLAASSRIISIKGSHESDQKELVDYQLGLSAKPDALIREKGGIIPVLIKPSTTKVKDRHVVELLASLRILAERESSAPPYGLLLMGQSKKRIELKYTNEKKVWLESLISEMRSIAIDNVPPLPSPSYHKCKHCDVRKLCSHSAYNEEQNK